MQIQMLQLLQINQPWSLVEAVMKNWRLLKAEIIANLVHQMVLNF
ncbi:hypothetical protein NIES4072_53220 [Nostoc commune NIES-4072]|uniref:Uncharacterized protein n=1 Tax=Nostoc commune NIES-4072 TaxID=2005467 RepID=A0A2R5G182_NOSCO|nr:hypothetical protein NIES4070_37730 [Nostoc commune HK-02]GBG21634.1 hypothetical protein NIES4072_53220 [Nostoc commune NIES-4072]